MWRPLWNILGFSLTLATIIVVLVTLYIDEKDVRIAMVMMLPPICWSSITQIVQSTREKL